VAVAVDQVKSALLVRAISVVVAAMEHYLASQVQLTLRVVVVG
jgi:hypothetical protein